MTFWSPPTYLQSPWPVQLSTILAAPLPHSSPHSLSNNLTAAVPDLMMWWWHGAGGWCASTPKLDANRVQTESPCFPVVLIDTCMMISQWHLFCEMMVSWADCSDDGVFFRLRCAAYECGLHMLSCVSTACKWLNFGKGSFRIPWQHHYSETNMKRHLMFSSLAMEWFLVTLVMHDQHSWIGVIFYCSPQTAYPRIMWAILS